MVKGLYTGASGMNVLQEAMNSISQNLANINTDGYKRETTVMKAFPEMLARRINDEGQVKFPLGSYDKAPIAGKIGTGVEYNESFINFDQGSLMQTDSEFDFALEGEGFFTLETPAGIKYSRNGSFTISGDGYVVDSKGNYLLGEEGRLRIARNNFKVDQQANITINGAIEFDDFTTKTSNDWNVEQSLGKLKIVNFKHPRYLAREGNHLYAETSFSGEAQPVANPKVLQGFLEKSNVQAVNEMVKMIEVQRLYEANQKVIQTTDDLLGQAVNKVLQA
ncbi:MAG: flagellar hook-basal body protein [Brevinemataceae bacterium]